MPFILPLISVALAVLAHYAFHEPNRRPLRWDVPRLAAIAVLAVAALAIAWKFAPKADIFGLDVGVFVGVLLTAALSGQAVTPDKGTLVPSLAVGVAGAAALHLLPTPSLAAGQFGLMCAAGLGALALGSELVTVAALAAVIATAADYMSARHSGSPSAPFLGSVIGISASVGGIAAGYLKGRLAFARGLVVGAVLLLGGLIGTQSIPEKYLLATLAIGAAAGLVIDWLLPDEEADAVRVGLSAIVGIGVATIAFGLARGAGMSAALLAAAGLLFATGNRRGLLTLGPLLGLVMFRVLGEAHPSASHALDIGQHYALLGLTLGALLPLLPTDWLRREGIFGAAGAVLWGALALGVPPLVLLMFGEKGAIGFVVGLGFSGVCQSLCQGRDLLPLALAGSMAVTTTLSLEWMTALSDTSRNEKIKAFEMASVALIVVAGLIAAVSRSPKKEAGK